MSKVFRKTKENFVCDRCGVRVFGTGYTNHCPACLWSKHVDVNPGDRAEGCNGSMMPLGVGMQSGEYIITHKCQTCGLTKRVKASDNDDISGFLDNMLK